MRILDINACKSIKIALYLSENLLTSKVDCDIIVLRSRGKEVIEVAKKASVKDTEGTVECLPVDIGVGEIQENVDKVRPITVRLNDQMALDFKTIAAENDMSQAQLIEKFIKDYKTNNSRGVQNTGLDNGIITFASLIFKKDNNDCINEMGYKVQFKGEIKYADQNRIYKEAIPYASAILNDYDIDVTNGDYMLFNTVCVVEVLSPILPNDIAYRYAVCESVIIASKKNMNEVVLRNDWFQFAEQPNELIGKLSTYVDVNQRVGISFAFSKVYEKDCMNRFIPKSLKNP